MSVPLAPLDEADHDRLARLLRASFGEQQQADAEKEEMDKFLLQHAQRYEWDDGIFGEIFRLLVSERFLPQASRGRALQPRDHRLRVLQCMRVLMRDPAHRAHFAEAGGADVLVNLFSELTSEHFAHPHGEFISEMLVETLSILKRFAALPTLCPAPHAAADEMKLQRALVSLLSTREAIVLQCVLVAMYQFVQIEPQMRAIGQLGSAEILLCILTDYEVAFKVIPPPVKTRGWVCA